MTPLVRLALFLLAVLPHSAQGFAPSIPVPAVRRQLPARRQALFVTLNEQTTVQERASFAEESPVSVDLATAAATTTDAAIQEEGLSETKKLMQKVKDAGTAGIISYALWELGFWLVSVPVVLFGYVSVVGHLPDLSNSDEVAKLGAEAFAFVNFARFAVPLRIGLALSTTSWIQENIVDRFMKEKGSVEAEGNAGE